MRNKEPGENYNYNKTSMGCCCCFFLLLLLLLLLFKKIFCLPAQGKWLPILQ